MAVIQRTLSGKWLLTSVENADAYLDAIHAPDEYRTKYNKIVTNLKDSKESYVEELMVDTVGGLMSRTIFIGDELRRHQRLVTIGTEFAQDMPDGRATKATLKLETETTMTKLVRGTDFESMITVTLSGCGQGITATMKSGTALCTEKYKRIEI